MSDELKISCVRCGKVREMVPRRKRFTFWCPCGQKMRVDIVDGKAKITALIFNAAHKPSQWTKSDGG